MKKKEVKKEVKVEIPKEPQLARGKTIGEGKEAQKIA